MLLEAACEQAGYSIRYLNYPYPFHIPIAKLHGSINWHSSWEGVTVEHGGSEQQDFYAKAKAIHTNHIGLGINLPDAEVVHDTSYRDLLYEEGHVYEPAVIPPLGHRKDYRKHGLYAHVWDYAEKMLNNASELVIIGCSLRKEDYRLRELLSENTPENIPITIVDPYADSLRPKVKEIFTNPRLREPYDSEEAFDDYTTDLLA